MLQNSNTHKGNFLKPDDAFLFLYRANKFHSLEFNNQICGLFLKYFMNLPKVFQYPPFFSAELKAKSVSTFPRSHTTGNYQLYKSRRISGGIVFIYIHLVFTPPVLWQVFESI
jgi:hypothetical protein